MSDERRQSEQGKCCLALLEAAPSLARPRTGHVSAPFCPVKPRRAMLCHDGPWRVPPGLVKTGQVVTVSGRNADALGRETAHDGTQLAEADNASGGVHPVIDAGRVHNLVVDSEGDGG